jgi:anionic cell wall polymer biosynthesis LytR-Cps2A-Psr (LCP) family protein
MNFVRHIDSLPRLFAISISLTLGFLSLFLLITAVGFGLWARAQIHAFTQAAHTTPAELMTLATVGWNTNPQQTDGRKNILILGLDSLSTRGDAPPLTDTMMIVSIDLGTGKLSSLSFPRDLWLEDYATRINALYVYGRDRYPDNPERFPQEVLSEVSGIPIHHTVVMSLDDLGEIIDLIGGVTVEVKHGFVDDQFPRTDVDVTVEHDPAKLYERIEFQPGVQTMSGSTALKFIRSRHAEGEEGTDQARSIRQQQVIEALMDQTFKPKLLSNPTKLGQLYALYKRSFAPNFPTVEAIATAKTLIPHRKNIVFTGHSLSIYPEDPQGVITHPPVSAYAGQWVYVIRDILTFQAEVKTKLN